MDGNLRLTVINLYCSLSGERLEINPGHFRIYLHFINRWLLTLDKNEVASEISFDVLAEEMDIGWYQKHIEQLHPRAIRF